jgi:hypothetical protein
VRLPNDPRVRSIAMMLCEVFDHPLEDWHELPHLRKLVPLVAAKLRYDDQRERYPTEEPRTTWEGVCADLGIDNPASALVTRQRYERKAREARARRDVTKSR